MASPTYTGIPTYFLAPAGVSVPLFADAVVNDALAVTATITLAYPANGTLSDSDAASDGSSYDNATGTYAVSGTAAQVTAAFQGLLFASPNAGPEGFTINLSDASPSTVSASFYGDDNLVTTYSGGGRTIVAPNSPAAVELVATLGDFDTVSTLFDPYVVVLDNAQAKLSGEAVVWLEGADDKADFKGAGAWDAVFGNDGDFTLDDASLSVSGADAQVQFSSAETSNAVSFYGPSTGGDHETVAGSDGQIIENYVDVAVTGDNELVYFNTSGDALDLTGATAGDWSTLYASSGAVDLHGASLNLVGGGVSVDAVSGDDAVSLYQTAGAADSVSGDDVTVTLNNAQAAVSGTGDAIWLVGGSASTATLNLSAGQSDSVYGPGTINLNGGAVDSVGGGALVDFETAGGTAFLSSTEGVYDRVQGAAGSTKLDHAQAVFVGGGQSVYYAVSGQTAIDDEAATLTATGGQWDSVYGIGDTLTIQGAQANVFGDFGDIVLSGAGAAVTLYPSSAGYDFGDQTVTGSNETVVLDTAYVTVAGGANAIYVDPTPFGVYETSQTLTNTNGAWDTVHDQGQFLTLDDAQTSLIGGDDTVHMGVVGDAVSLYDTGGADDSLYSFGAVTLNDAQASLFGSGFYVYFAATANALDIPDYSTNDLLTFVGAFGQDTIKGFGSGAGDSIALSHTEFANYQAFAAAFTQQGANAVLTLDAADTVTFVGLQTSAVTSSQVKFV